MSEINLRLIRKTGFLNLYERLLKNENLSADEKLRLLKLGIIFLNSEDIFVERLGYRIILQYSNKYQDFIPLYDVSFNKGYIPIAKFIENKYKNQDHFEDSFFNIFLSSYKENFRKDNIYLTEEQLEMNFVFVQNKKETYAIIAPTSYGKSELMISVLQEYKNDNICILVPTKALLAQIKQRVINSNLFSLKRKIITHPEMYIEGDTNFIAIFTQERLLKLLQEYRKLSFGLVFVDEAHNLLEDDSRNRLLAASIAVLEKRDKHTVFKFLSPFLINSSNLKVSHTRYSINDYKINEHLKIERFYCYNFNKDNTFKLYDQFMNKFIIFNEEKFENDVDLILKKKGRKNIIYLNKPPDIERITNLIKQKLKPVDSEKIKKACIDISKYLHKDYSLVECLKFGIVYHHGSVPDNVRLYIEYLFSNEDEISFIVTSSTLLEGVNIPAEKLFLLDYKKGTSRLSPSQFKNLTGRVCRFKEIFDSNKGDLKMLEPEIFVIASDYVRADADIDGFLQNSIKVDKEIKERTENVLLKETKTTDKNKKDKSEVEEFLENIEPGIISSDTNRYAKTKIGNSCFVNSVVEIDIINNEEALQSSIEKIAKEQGKAKTAEEAISFIAQIFIDYTKEGFNFENLKRLKEIKAQMFYTMFLNWRIRGTSYNEMVNSFLNYWSKKEKEFDTWVFVGKWGDQPRGGHRKLWTDIRNKTQVERVNLAIVRIKEEQDFVDNTLIKFIEILNDCDLIENGLYDTIKYGTSDKQKIIMIKNGMSLSLVTLFLERYAMLVEIDLTSNTVNIDPNVINEMKKNDENEILIFEAMHNVKNQSV